MSIQDALDFFHAVRRRPDVQEQLAAWGPVTTASRLVELAERMGFCCSTSDLQEALRRDWIMRWLRYGGADEVDPIAAAADQGVARVDSG